MKLSIIIPIYNVEQYIEETLETIFSQNIAPYIVEYILINDGSTDSSMNIATNLIKKHDIQVHIINQNNQGLSCARNAGLKIAKGEYIWFIDSDDSIKKDSINTIIKYLDQYQADILAFDMICIYESNRYEKISSIFHKRKYKRLYFKSLNKFDIFNKIKETPVQRFIYKREFLKNKSMTFLPGIYHEDNEFMVRALFYAKKIVPISYAPYRYLIRVSGSITSTKSLKHIKDKFTIIQSLQDFSKKNAKNKSEEHFLNFYIFILLHNMLKEETYHEYCQKIPINKLFLRKVIINGTKASCHFLFWRSFLNSLIDLFKV